MSFLAGGLWPLLLAAGLPLLIHLLTRRPPRPLTIATIKLLQRALKRHERRLRMRRWLLLAVRTLWVAALVLAMLRPTLGEPPKAASVDRGPIAVVIDASGSMDVTGKDGERFYDRAIEAAGDQASQRPISLFACTVRGLKRLAPEPRAGLDVPGLMAAVEPLGSADLSACLHAVQGPRLLITDGWSGQPGHDDETLLVAAAGEGRNWGLGGVTMRRRGGRLYGLRVEVVGRPGRRKLSALVNGELRAETMVTVPASGQVWAQLTIGLKPGLHQVDLRLPNDGRAADNSRTLALLAAGATQVLAINGDARDTAYADELYYVQQAARALDVVDPFELTVVPVGGELDAPLQSSDVVVLANVAELDPGFARALGGFVRAGGGLLISDGNNADPLRIATTLGSLVPGQLRARWFAQDDEGRASKKAAIGVGAMKPEFVKTLGLVGTAGLGRTSVWSGVNMEAQGDVVWRMDDGRPLLVVARDGGIGRRAILTTSIDRDGADLAIRPGFVPMMRGLLRHLAGERASAIGPSVLPGEDFLGPASTDSLTMRRHGGGVAQMRREGQTVRFTPPRLGLWHGDGDLTVEARTDPAEGRPGGQSEGLASTVVGGGPGGGEGHPMAPFLFGLAMVLLGVEAWLVLADHRGRVAS